PLYLTCGRGQGQGPSPPSRACEKRSVSPDVAGDGTERRAFLRSYADALTSPRSRRSRGPATPGSLKPFAPKRPEKAHAGATLASRRLRVGDGEQSSLFWAYSGCRSSGPT